MQEQEEVQEVEMVQEVQEVVVERGRSQEPVGPVKMNGFHHVQEEVEVAVQEQRRVGEPVLEMVAPLLPPMPLAPAPLLEPSFNFLQDSQVLINTYSNYVVLLEYAYNN